MSARERISRLRDTHRRWHDMHEADFADQSIPLNARTAYLTRHELWHQRCAGHIRRHPVRHRLYRQIYFGFMGVVLCVCLIAAAMFWTLRAPGEASMDAHIIPLMARLLPEKDTVAAQNATLANIAGTTHGNVALYDRAGHRIAASDADMPMSLPAPNFRRSRSLTNVIQLPDGRRLLMRWGSHIKRIALAWIAAVALLVALGTWPVARRLTRRLERLQQQADAWGEGKLSARMAVDGCDEVAELARRFNQAAERVEALVSSQRTMLASASHELRSPLARIRMAMDLLGDAAGIAESIERADGLPATASDAAHKQSRPDLHAQIARDIAELDTLIGDLLLASRLAEESPRLLLENVDLLGLAAEEASRVGVAASGEAISVQGDARLLRHLIRNLLDNSRRYGIKTEADAPACPPPEIEVQQAQDYVVIRVLDRGPGVPASEREKVFEPFYRLAGSAEHGDGAGYGLALVRRIARLHGGDAVCWARAGGGACFEVRLSLKAPFA